MLIEKILISIIEGVTEFLPVSSTAHIIILSKLINIDLSLPEIKFHILFIQLGALLAGLFVYIRKEYLNSYYIYRVAVSFMPSAFFGFIFYKAFKKLLEGNFLLMTIMLVLVGAALTYVDSTRYNGKVLSKEKSKFTLVDAFILGIAQSIAIIPGVSRSGITIVAGRLLKIKKEIILDYTFVLALPTIAAAVTYDFYKTTNVVGVNYNFIHLMTGFGVAFVIAYLTLTFIRKHLKDVKLRYFSYYRYLLAVLVFVILYL